MRIEERGTAMGGARVRGSARRSAATLAAAIAALAAALGSAAPASLGAVETHCPNNPGGTAAVMWGSNGRGELGAGYRGTRENTPRTVLGLTNVKQLQIGFQFSIAVLADCTAVTWGSDFKNALGDGLPLKSLSHPVKVVNLTEIKEVAPSKGFEPRAMALEYNGTVWTWGASEFGTRGNGERGFEGTAKNNEREKAFAKPRYEPTEVPGLANVKQIAAGARRDYALLASGEVLAWGGDEFGELGIEIEKEEFCNGEPTPGLKVSCSVVPRNVKINGPHGLENLTGVEKIAAGHSAAYAVRKGGTELLGWGANEGGQLLRAGEHVTPATKLEWTPPSPIVEVSPGNTYVLVRLANGQVFSWGDNGHGQLGFASGEGAEECARKVKCTRTPVYAAALTHVLSIAAGEGRALALKEEQGGKRVVYSFGANGHAELLGLGRALEGQEGPQSETTTPMPIEGLASVALVSLGASQGTAVLESGSGPPSPFAVSPLAKGAGMLVEWATLAEAYSVRWHPAANRHFSPPREIVCTPGQWCPGSVRAEELATEPYVFILSSGPQVKGKPELDKKQTRPRTIIGTPEPPPGAPASESPPTLPPSAHEGAPITATPGKWGNSPTTITYQWLQCGGSGANGSNEEFGEECEAINGATGRTYVPTTGNYENSDFAHTLVFVERAGNANTPHGPIAAFSEPVLVHGVAKDEEGEEEVPAPENSTPPVINSPVPPGENPKPGQTLTLEGGTWLHEPLIRDWWYRCRQKTAEQELAVSCHVITEPPKAEKEKPAPQEGATYTLGPEDVGNYIEVQERAQNSGGFNTAISSSLFVEGSEVPQNISPPKIIGTPQQDQKLAEEHGEWTNNPNPKGYKYQWLRCDTEGKNCAALKERKETILATKPEYEVVSGDIGHTIRVEETASNAVGPSPTAAVSEPTSVVPESPRAPTNESKPKVTGAARQGETLTSIPATWSFESFSKAGHEYPKAFDYQWKRCKIGEKGKEVCEPTAPVKRLSASAETTYVVTAEDIGSWIKMRETVRIPGSVEAVESERTEAVVGTPPRNIAVPMIEGTLRQGATLSEIHGKWTGEPQSYTYQWKRCSQSSCEDIAGATGQQYLLTPADAGHEIAVEETASNATGTSSPASSAQTSEVLPEEPTTTSPPTISGTARQGQTLTELHAPWSNSPTSFAYQWKRCDGTGAGCSPISGATSQTYQLIAEDVGHTIRVQETAFNAGGWNRAESEPTAVVVVATPTVTKVEPAKGRTAGETPVTITGENLSEATSVEFGLIRATSFKVNTPTSITAISPAGAGTVHVVVTTPVGMSAQTERDLFTYVPPPSVAMVEPNQGPEAGGASVTITGENLAEANAVKFGASSATSFEVLSASSIRATSPAGVGTVDVTVTTPYGSSSAGTPDRYTYALLPAVTKVAPNSGSAAGGESVTITGKNLTGATLVRFGSGTAEIARVESTKVIARSPAGSAGMVDVTVTTPGGTSTVSSKDRFTYTPVVTSLSPAKGLPIGGTSVTVKGAGFAMGTTATTFKFGATKSGAVNCTSSIECTVTSPKHAQGTVDVVATVNATNSPKRTQDQFTYSLT